MLVDLHMHSTYSDGRYTPSELVKVAVYNNIRVIALTDHDSWNGYPEAVQEAERINKRYMELLNLGNTSKQGLKLIKEELKADVIKAERKSTVGAPLEGFVSNVEESVLANTRVELPLIQVLTGIELSTQQGNNSVHILGYHVDRSFEPLREKMDDLRYKREHRLEAMVAKAQALGMEITVESCDPSARAVGRPHLAKAMVAKGYVKTVQEAFDKYLHRGGPCYVEQPKLTPAQAVDYIHGAGGLAVLAHPSEIADSELVEKLLKELPFDGVEIWHPSARINDRISKWLQLAEKYILRTSGGSDFHGIPDRYPEKLGLWKVCYESVAPIIENK